MKRPASSPGSSRRVVVTGLGVVAPNGIGHEAFWRASMEGRRVVAPLSRFDASGYACAVAGQIEDFRAEDFVARNVVKQTDRSTHMALASCRLATEDAGLDLAREVPERVGMYFANIFGGMDFAENELWTQSFVGPERVSAYQSIAWFFAATQGQWSISTGIKGFGKSIVADRAGGHQALLLGALAIRQGYADVVYAGGFEAPLVPYVYRIHESTGLLSPDRGAPEAAYRPFDAGRSGLVLAEGSAVLVLEEAGRAVRRGARIHGEVAGGAMTFDGPDADSEALESCLRSALANAGLDPRQIGCVLPEGLAVAAADHREAAAISRVLGPGAAVSLPKARTGHALAAAGALDAVWALLMLSHGTFLAPVNCECPDAGADLSLARPGTEGAGPEAILCAGRGYGGVNAALALRAFAGLEEAA